MILRLKYFDDSLNIVLILAPFSWIFLYSLCPISFNIYEMKLNEVHLFSVTVIIHFLDKPYQKITFKNNLNSALFRK